MTKRTYMMMMVMILGVVHWGCAGSSGNAKAEKQTVVSIKQGQGHRKSIAIVLTHWPQTEFGRRIGDLYLNTIIETLQDKNPRLRLVTDLDPAFSDLLNVRDQASKTADTLMLARKGRLAGINGIVAASIHNLRPLNRKTGLFWFRKMRYYLYFDLFLDLYDPITAAKTVSLVEEASIQISEDDFENFQSATTISIEKLDRKIVDLAEDMGEQTAETLADLPWQTTVVKVQGTSIFLPAGSRAGLQTGGRLAVFKGSRILEGQGAEKFFAPGFKIGEMVITAVSPQAAEAEADGSDNIQEGDIVVPVE